jgi:hypothetical protein
MEALTIFKQAGLEDFLSGVRNEWDNGHFLKPMAVGAGLGGLGYGGSALLDNKKDEKGGDKAKRVLTQLLKGTALGGAAGGAYGGLSYAFGAKNEAPKEKAKGNDNAFTQGEQKPTGEPKGVTPKSEPGSWESFGETNRKNPVKSVLESSAYGAGAGGVGGAAAGGGAGMIADKMNVSKPNPMHNPDYVAGKTVESYTKPDGLLGEAIKRTTASGKPLTSSDTLSNLAPASLKGQHSGEVVGMMKKLLEGKGYQMSPADITAAGQHFGTSSSMPDKSFTDSLSKYDTPTPSKYLDERIIDKLFGEKPISAHTDIPSIKNMMGIEQAAQRSHMLRGSRFGAGAGGILGALTGAGLNIASQNTFPEAPLNVPSAPLGMESIKK